MEFIVKLQKRQRNPCSWSAYHFTRQQYMWRRVKRSFPGIAGIVAIVVSLIVIAGWLLRLPLLTSMVPGFTSMKFNAAFCFLLIGIALLCVALNSFRVPQKIACCVVVFIGCLTLLEYIARMDVGIDEWLMTDPHGADKHPGRMGLAAAFNFVLIGLSLLLVNIKRFAMSVQLLAFAVMLISGVTLIGEDFSSPASILLPQLTTMTLPASLLFIVVSASITYNPLASSQSLSLEWKLISGFSIVMALTLLSFIVFVRNSREFKYTSERVDHTNEVLYTCEQIISAMKDVQTGTRGFVITGQDRFLDPVHQSQRVVQGGLAKLKEMTADNPNQKAPIDSLEVLAQNIIAFNQQLIITHQRKGFESAAALVKTQVGEDFMQNLRMVNKKIQNVEKGLLKNRREAAHRSATQAERTSRLVGAFILLTMLLLFIIIQRNTRARNLAEVELLESKEWFSTTLSSIGDAVIATDMQGLITFMNPVAQQLTGWGNDEAKGKPFDTVFDIVHETSGEQVESPVGKVLSLGVAVELANHTLLKRRDGATVAIDDSAAPIRNANGSIRGVVLVFRDVTSKKENERALRESEEKFQRAFHATAAGMTITRLADAKYIDVNEAFTEITGFSRDELIGRASSDLNLVVTLAKREEVLRQIRERGKARDFEMTIRHKSGKHRDVMVSVETILLKDEKFALNIIYDISLRKEAERQLESTIKELEAFSYSVSHDLRAPLRSILGYANILEEEGGAALNQEALQALRIVTQNARRMNRLIEDLLEFSRLGRKDIIRTPIVTSEVVSNIVHELRASWPQADVKIGTLPIVLADLNLLTQVWTNLLSNAFKYSSKKEKPVIEVHGETTETEHIFYITDNGAGFDMKYVDKLFGVFQRLHKAQEFEGTGVGLSIVQRIIVRHGGRVWAEGKVNEGASFRFSLPL